MLLIVSWSNAGKYPLLVKTAEALGWDTQIGCLPKDLTSSPGAVYGDPFYCSAVAKKMNWKLLNNPFDWLTKLPEEYVNRSVYLTTLSAARKLTEEKFIRPISNKYSFDARIYATGTELPVVGQCNLPEVEIFDEIPVLVSDVMKITSEYRCVVKNRRVTTACCYYLKSFGMQEAQINKPENYYNNYEAVVKFLNAALQDERVECTDTAIIDVARFKKDTYTILGSSPIYSSDVYGCEIVAFLDGLKGSCINV